jgi:hypothetical protein
VIIVYGLMVSCVAAGVCAYESPKSINHQSRIISQECKGKGGQDWYFVKLSSMGRTSYFEHFMGI